MKKILAVLAASAALVLGLTACGASTPPPSAVPPTAPAETSAPAPEPAEPEAGSLENPYPVGHIATVWEGTEDNVLLTISAAVKDANAGVAIAQANQFNDPAQPGYHYLAVEYTVTGMSKTEPVNVSWTLTDFSLAQADGILIAESNTIVVYPDGWSQSYDVNDLYAGQTGTAVVLYQVPDAYTGPLFVTAYGSYIAL